MLNECELGDFLKCKTWGFDKLDTQLLHLISPLGVCQTGQLLRSFSLFPLLDSISLGRRQNLDHTQGHADVLGETLYRVYIISVPLKNDA